MGYYIGQFYFDKRDIFLILAMIMLGVAAYLHIDVPFFHTNTLFFLLLLMFIAKGVILPVYDTAIFIAFFIAALMTLFVPLFQSLIFLLLAFIFMRMFKAI